MLKQLLLSTTLLSAVALPALATEEEWTIGSDTWKVDVTETQLCPGVKYTLVNWLENRSSTYKGSRLHVIEADLTNPKISIENLKTPGVMTGNRTLINHAKSVHTTKHQAVAGANANFWITSPESGNYACMGTQSHGVVISDGVMYTDPNVRNFAHCGGPISATGLLAIDEEGNAYLDYLTSQTTDNNQSAGSGFQFAATDKRIGHRLVLDMCNRWVTYDCASIFTRAYGTDKKFRVGDLTGATGTWTENVGKPGTTDGNDGYIEILLDYAEGVTAMNVGAETDYVVKEIRYYPADTEATVGCLGDHDLAIVGRYLFALVPGTNWQVGDAVSLDTKINFVSHGSPDKIAQAISGNVMAMKNGNIRSTVTTEAYNSGYNARTVYGLSEDRTKLYIMTCEHRAYNSTTSSSSDYYGFTLNQLCLMGKEKFGINNLTQVDCGGSAQMYVNGQQAAKSYDTGGQRAVYNGLFVFYNDNDMLLNEPGSNEPPVVDFDEGWTDSGERAHYAYDLALADDNDAPTVSYTLTGAVKEVSIVLTNRNDSTDVVTIDGTTAAGVNTVVLDESKLKANGDYDWKVVVASNPVSSTSHFLHVAPDKLDARGGVGIVTDPESSAYGRLITSTGYAQGFGLYDQQLNKLGQYHAATSPWLSTNRSSTYRIAMRDHRVAYACDFSDKGAGYWKFDPEDPETAPTNLIGGVNDGTGAFYLASDTDKSTVIGSGGSGIAFQGTGEDTRLWLFAEDWPSGNNKTYKGILSRWDIGNDNIIEKGVNAAYGDYAGTGILANQNACLTATPNGVFAAQHRTGGQNTATVPAFFYTDIYGTMLYNSGEHADIINSCAGSVAITDDLSLMAVSGYNENIRIFSVTWADNVPTLTLLTQVNDTKHCTEVSQLAFDPAGNLFAWQRSSTADYAGLFGYSWKNDNPTATTPARIADHIVMTNYSGIDSIVTDTPAAEPIYYTIQGVRVDSAALVPGLYIKVTGKTAEKVVVK